MNNTNDLQNFCKNVKLLRETHGLSQKEMAKICGIGVQSLSTLESGICPPRISCSILFRLSKHFHIPISTLFLAW